MPRSIDFTKRTILQRGKYSTGLSAGELQNKDVNTRIIDVAKAVDWLIRDRRPDYIDFYNITVASAAPTYIRLDHNFGCAVRWYVVDWAASTSYIYWCLDRMAPDSNGTYASVPASVGATDPLNQLVLRFYDMSGTAAIRVEPIL
jgi:hypothetical protein